MGVMLLGILLFGLLLIVIFSKRRAARHSEVKRRIYIDSYPFPARVSDKLRRTYPHLTDPQIKRVLDGLRQYFQICRMANKQTLSMPSQAVDVAWHEFILFTRSYQTFCKRAFGHFLHHVPAEAMSSKEVPRAGIKRAWRLACQVENLNPAAPVRLPLLFMLDKELAIADGFYYNLNCGPRGTGQHANEFCASHIGCGSGGGDGIFDSHFNADADGSGCSSGCSGGGD